MFQIKVLFVEGLYKALVLDMSIRGNRIVAVYESLDEMLAYNEAQAYIDLNDKTEDSELCH